MKRIILSVLALGATGVAMAQVNPQKGYVTTKFDDLGDADIDDPNFCGFDQIPSLSSQRIIEESCD